MEKTEKNNNLGCLIIIIVWVIVSIVLAIKGESAENFAYYGRGIIAFAGIAIGYMLIKFFRYGEENNKISCIGSLVIGALVSFMTNKAIENFGLTYSIGIIAFVIIVVIMGIVFYNITKE